MKFKYIVLVAVSIVASFSCTKDFVAQEEGDAEHVGSSVTDDDVLPGWVRVQLSPDVKPLRVGAFTRGSVESGNAELDVLAVELGATEIRKVFSDGGKFAERRRRAGLHLWYDIRIAEEVAISRATVEVGKIDGVQHTQPIYKVNFVDTNNELPSKYVYRAARPVLNKADMPFNDPELDKQWHYYNDGLIAGSVVGADINLFEGWRKFGGGKPEVIVAVIDQGVDFDHPDLAANMWVNLAEKNGVSGVDDDSNGYVDDVHGYNYVDNKGAITPGGHGTHIAGTIAAVNNNGVGVCGIAGGTGVGDGVRIMSLQFEPGYADARFLDAFAYAADMGAVVTSNSWVLNMDSTPKDVGAAIDYFNANAGLNENGIQTGPIKGGLCVFAAGNFNGSGPEYEGRAFYPAADPRVVAVGAMRGDYVKASYSQYGQGVDIMAPGGENIKHELLGVYSTLVNDYGYSCGTSMATPHVAGAAALIVSNYGVGKVDFTSADLRRKLLASCRDVGAYQEAKWNYGIGAGLVDVGRLDVDSRNPGTKPAWSEAPKIEGVADGIVFSCKVPADGSGEPVTWVFINVIRKNEVGAVATELRYGFNSKIGEEFNLTLKAIGDNTYGVEMYAQDRYGNQTDRIVKDIKTLPHINIAPRLRGVFGDVVIYKGEAALVRTIDLTSNFFDSDVSEFGDELTYSIESIDDSSVATMFMEEALLKISPKGVGVSRVVVRATDKAGEFVDASFNLTVYHKPFNDIEIASIGREYALTFNAMSSLYSPPGNTYSVSISSSNRNVALVTIDKLYNIVVTPVSKGDAVVTMEIKGSLPRFNPISSSFSVKVLGEDGVGSKGDMVVSPSLVEDNLRLVISEKPIGSRVVARVYDGASRLISNLDGFLDANGSVSFNVAGMSQGVYSVVATVVGDKYDCSFVKK